MSFTATMFAAQSIQLGINDIVVAGGMESMSNAPKYLADARYAFHHFAYGRPCILLIWKRHFVILLPWGAEGLCLW